MSDVKDPANTTDWVKDITSGKPPPPKTQPKTIEKIMAIRAGTVGRPTTASTLARIVGGLTEPLAAPRIDDTPPPKPAVEPTPPKPTVEAIVADLGRETMRTMIESVQYARSLPLTDTQRRELLATLAFGHLSLVEEFAGVPFLDLRAHCRALFGLSSC